MLIFEYFIIENAEYSLTAVFALRDKEKSLQNDSIKMLWTLSIVYICVSLHRSH